jgi:hypothetical protein
VGYFHLVVNVIHPTIFIVRRSLLQIAIGNSALRGTSPVRDIQTIWEAAYQNPTNDNLLELYLANSERYPTKPNVTDTWPLRWYIEFLRQLRTISDLSLTLGLGEINWSPFVSNDEIMTITPFMNKEFLHYEV